MNILYNTGMWFLAILMAAFMTCCSCNGSGSDTSASLNLTPGGGTGVDGEGIGPAPVILGEAGNFVILSKAGITNAPESDITGIIGSSPITSAAMDNVFCLEITGTIYGVDAAYTGNGGVTCFSGSADDKTMVDNAVKDMDSAYTDAAGRTADYNELGGGDISGMSLPPAVYKWSSGVIIPKDVTLNGGPKDVWIFVIAQDLVMSSAARITLTGGALPRNVYWQIFGVLDIATTAHFEGIAMVHTAITMKTGASVNGRLLAGTAVSLQSNEVKQP